MSNCGDKEVQGLRVTSAERTVLDCTRTLAFPAGLALADSATRLCHWDNLHIWTYLARGNFGGLRGLSRARIVALLADARSESGGESVARANMIREGFLLPELQVRVPGTSRGRSYRVDFAWQQAGERPIFGELDGRIKYTDTAMLGGSDALDALLRERRRESDLSRSTASIVRFSFSEAESRRELAQRLDLFSVPRVTKPLTFTDDARHNLREIRRYLLANAERGAEVEARLDALMSYLQTAKL